MLGRPVVPFELLSESHPATEYAMLVAIGFSGVNKTRAAGYERCKSAGYELITYVHSRAEVWDGVPRSAM